MPSSRPVLRKVSPPLIALFAACALAAPALAEGEGRHTTAILPENPEARAIYEKWGFAQAVVAGDTVYLSGVVVGLAPGETDLEAAYTRAFEHIGQILGKAGVGWADVVDMTTYHTDVTAQLDAIVAVKHRYVKPPFHAWTAIQVTRLVPDGGLTEIKVVAHKPQG